MIELIVTPQLSIFEARSSIVACNIQMCTLFIWHMTWRFYFGRMYYNFIPQIRYISCYDQRPMSKVMFLCHETTINSLWNIIYLSWILIRVVSKHTCWIHGQQKVTLFWGHYLLIILTYWIQSIQHKPIQEFASVPLPVTSMTDYGHPSNSLTIIFTFYQGHY